MGDITLIEGIIKILEIPKKKSIDNNITFVEFRAQLSCFRQPQIVQIICWGNLAQDVVNYYEINPYIFIEGYPSLQNLTNETQTSKQLEIIGLRVYPIGVHKDNLNKKI